MSDVMPMCKGCEKLFALLTAERAEHAEEVVNLKRELTRVSCMHSDARTKVINLEHWRRSCRIPRRKGDPGGVA